MNKSRLPISPARAARCAAEARLLRGRGVAAEVAVVVSVCVA